MAGEVGQHSEMYLVKGSISPGSVRLQGHFSLVKLNPSSVMLFDTFKPTLLSLVSDGYFVG